MWWRDEQDPQLFDTLAPLVERWYGGELAGVTAIGSTWDRFGERVPFVGVEPRLIDRAALGRDDVAFSLGHLPHLARWVPMEFFSRSQPRMRLPKRGLVAPLAGVRPLARRRAFFHQDRSGSLGCGLVTARGQVATTAGHALSHGGNLRWQSAATRLLRVKAPYAGQVVAATCPEDPDSDSDVARGVDLGILELDRRTAPAAHRVLIPADPRTVSIEHRCRWTGGRSGRHRGSVLAFAQVCNRPEEPYVNTYVVHADLSWRPAVDGDSGTLVCDDGGAVLGHLIGTVGADGLTRRGMSRWLWVQDLHTALAYAAEKVGPVRATVDLA